MDADTAGFDREELQARVRRTIAETEKLSAEARKLIAEMEKLRGELRFQPWSILFQGTLAATAVVGAGIAIAKFFLT